MCWSIYCKSVFIPMVDFGTTQDHTPSEQMKSGLGLLHPELLGIEVWPFDLHEVKTNKGALILC